MNGRRFTQDAARALDFNVQQACPQNFGYALQVVLTDVVWRMVASALHLSKHRCLLRLVSAPQTEQVLVSLAEGWAWTECANALRLQLHLGKGAHA